MPVSAHSSVKILNLSVMCWRCQRKDSHLAAICANIGKGIKNMREVLQGQILGIVLASVGGPVDVVCHRAVALRSAAHLDVERL